MIFSKSPLAPLSQSSGLTVRRIVTYSTEIVGDGFGVQIIGGRDIVVIQSNHWWSRHRREQSTHRWPRHRREQSRIWTFSHISQGFAPCSSLVTGSVVRQSHRE